MDSFYDEIGGDTIARIVARFYEGVATDEVLRPLYPEEDLGPAQERFTLFLQQSGVAPRRTPTGAAIRGSGCGTRRSPSPRTPRTTG